MNKLLLVCLVWLSSCAFTIPQYTYVTPAEYYVPVATNVYNSPHGLPLGTYEAGTNCTIVGEFNHWYIVRGAGNVDYWIRREALVPRGSPGSSGAQTYADAPTSPTPQGTTHNTYTGPRGGHYYINGNGNKTYVTPQSTINSQNVQTGPRGGQYYINSHGNKTYIKH
jgi:hypothetical protein